MLTDINMKHKLPIIWILWYESANSQISNNKNFLSPAKSKQNAGRNAQKQQQQQQGAPVVHNNNNGAAPVKPPQLAPVPQPQPSKPSNKSHKKNELNLKGANKEGTDMDAFNDNSAAEREEINANTIAPNHVAANDIANANNVANEETPNNKKVQEEQQQQATAKPEPPVKQLKTKIDITDIVKEKPKPIKPFSAPVQAADGLDETDRSTSLTAEKLVQAKNEVNAKVSESNGIEKSLYKDGE